jgi:hypothetical protein
MSFTPSWYTLHGTPQPSRSILDAVIAGNIYNTVYYLKLAKPDTVISWGWEPYSVLNTPEQLEMLKMVMDDPRFDFSPEFLCACSYWTPKPLRDLVWSHPRAKPWLQRPQAFEAAAVQAYMTKGRTWNAGLGARVHYGDMECAVRALKYRRQQQWRLTFLLYPALKFWMARRLEDYYAPGGKGYEAAKQRFETAVAAPTPPTPLPENCLGPPPLQVVTCG